MQSIRKAMCGLSDNWKKLWAILDHDLECAQVYDGVSDEDCVQVLTRLLERQRRWISK
jgi:hypothetical protein